MKFYLENNCETKVFSKQKQNCIRFWNIFCFFSKNAIKFFFRMARMGHHRAVSSPESCVFHKDIFNLNARMVCCRNTVWKVLRPCNILFRLCCVISTIKGRSCIHSEDWNSKGGFTHNPVTAYDPAYGQRQSSHRLRWPYPGEFFRFWPASGLLKIVLSKPDCRGCRWWCSCCMREDWRVIQILQSFLLFNGTNRSGVGAKNFYREPQPKNFDAWSRSPKLEFWLHSPDCKYHAIYN